MNWVIDASVALKWFLRFRAEEDHVSQAIALLEQTLSGAGEVIQPPHFTAEMAAVLARVKPDTAIIFLTPCTMRWLCCIPKRCW